VPGALSPALAGDWSKLVLVVTTHTESNGTAWVTIRKIRGLLDALAYVASENGCLHGGADGTGFCLISAPGWMWWVGVPVPALRLNLGDALWRFGQWAFARVDEIPKVHRHEVTRAMLEDRFGWAKADSLDEAGWDD
jgi:hypothetical protein